MHSTVAVTLEDVREDLGNVPAARIRTTPPPGQATAQDWEAARAGGEVVELVDGTLVEKAMSFEASIVGLTIGRIIGNWLASHRIAVASGADGFYRMVRGNRRGPDVGVLCRDRWPDGRPPRGAAAGVSPDLAVEVLSPDNTRGEMRNKRIEYFDGGTRLVWIVDVVHRSVAVYTSVERFTLLGEDDTIDGGDVLPGFEAKVAAFFEDLDAEVATDAE